MTSKIGSSSCCSCFGRKKEEKVERPKGIQRSANFHHYKATDINQIISLQIDEKAKKEAENAAQVFKEAEK